MAKPTFTERLKRGSKLIKAKTPGLSWREATDIARSNLYANNVFPSYNAGVKEFWWKNHKNAVETPTPSTSDTDEAATENPPTNPIANAEGQNSSENAPQQAVDSVMQPSTDAHGQESDAND